MSIGDIIVCACIIICSIWAAVVIYRDRKNGRCCGNCSGCNKCNTNIKCAK